MPIPFVRDIKFEYGKVDQVSPMIRRVTSILAMDWWNEGVEVRLAAIRPAGAAAACAENIRAC